MKKATRKRATALDLSNPFALATIGTSFSPAAYCDRETGRPVTTLPQPELATHVFEPTGDGCLRHSVNGRERAIVHPGRARRLRAHLAGLRRSGAHAKARRPMTRGRRYVLRWCMSKRSLDGSRGGRRFVEVGNRPR